MTPDAATVEKVRHMIADAQKRGLDWGDMRANAHKAAEGLGLDIYAVIVSPNDSNDNELSRLAKRAAELRAEYAAFVDLWMDDASKPTTPPPAGTQPPSG